MASKKLVPLSQHRSQIIISKILYDITSTRKEDSWKLIIRNKLGDRCEVFHTDTMHSISGNDKRGKSFKFTLRESDRNIKGTLRVGRRRVSAIGTRKSVMKSLTRQMSTLSTFKKNIPNSKSIKPLSNVFRRNRDLVSFLTASPKRSKRKTYCESVCDCCAGGGTFGPWCCLSCASCDIFSCNLANVARLAGKFTMK